jgi:tetratricopeptide (TPR) repeat protein
LAWSWLADVLVTDYSNRWNEANNADPAPGRQLLADAKEALGQALGLDADLDIANYANGLVHRADGNHHASLMAFSRVIEINQYFARAYAQKGAQLVNLGRPEDAPALVRKAISLSPVDPSLGVFYWIIARAFFFRRLSRIDPLA